jgi:hypothetical protein
VVLSSKNFKNHRESANAPKTHFKGDKLVTKMRILVSTPGFSVIPSKMALKTVPPEHQLQFGQVLPHVEQHLEDYGCQFQVIDSGSCGRSSYHGLQRQDKSLHYLISVEKTTFSC